MYPRHRLDGLADAIYGVAMTLLVLDIRLPEEFDPRTSQQLLDGLVALSPKIWPYVLSFAVLGARWRAIVKDRDGHHPVERIYVTWWLAHLLSVTFVPFTSMLIGRYASLAPSIWVYAANVAALSVTSWGLAASGPEAEKATVGENRIGTIVLLVSAALAAAIAFVDSTLAPLAFLLNVIGTPLTRWLEKPRPAAPGAGA